MNIIAAIILPIDDDSLDARFATQPNTLILTKAQRATLWKGEHGMGLERSCWVSDYSTAKWEAFQKRPSKSPPSMALKWNSYAYRPWFGLGGTQSRTSMGLQKHDCERLEEIDRLFPWFHEISDRVERMPTLKRSFSEFWSLETMGGKRHLLDLFKIVSSRFQTVLSMLKLVRFKSGLRHFHKPQLS